MLASKNPAEIKLMDQYKREMYDAAVIYKNFLASEQDNIERDNIYMISKEYIDYFKEKIKYNELNDLFKENTDDNFYTFDEKIGNFTLNELEGIIFRDVKIFGELDNIEDNIEKGFELVNKDFMEKLEFDLDYEDPSIKVKYIKDSKNKIVIFNDESKLLIIPHEKEIKYHAIPAPIKSTQSAPLRRASTIYIENRVQRRI